MKFLLFLTLAGCAVKCDDSNYYVIQMPDFDAPRTIKKPFRVYWNVPTMQCKSKRIPFENLYDKFGIIQNKNDSFRGEKIAILYDPGLFPALLKNESTGEYKFRNGGVPQEGDLERHLITFRSVLDQSVPDPNFNGVGIIDFESWRPVFRQNFGVLMPYKDVSYEIERKMHWLWPKTWIQAEAKQRFEEKARVFMQTTLSIAKQMRPNALWGYYGFPYCFNMAAHNMQGRCADRVPSENDNTYWLWSESTALYPSVYSSSSLSSYQVSQLVAGRVSEAARVRRNGTPILPYFWFRYINKNAGFFTKPDLQAALKTMYQSESSGFIIWGSSNDVNSVDKCVKLLKYVEEILGPAIAEYTKLDEQINDDVLNDTTNRISIAINDSTTTTTTTTTNPVINETEIITSTTPPLEVTMENVTATMKSVAIETDPEFLWDPPENYTKDIVRYVEEEFKEKIEKEIVRDGNNEMVIQNLKESVLIDIILDVFKKMENSSNLVRTETNEYTTNTTPFSPTIREVSTTTSVYDTTTDVNNDYYLRTSTYLNSETATKILDEVEVTDVYADEYVEGTIDNTTESYKYSTEIFDITSQVYTQDSTLFNQRQDYTINNSDIETSTIDIIEENKTNTNTGNDSTGKPSKDKRKGFSTVTTPNAEVITTITDIASDSSDLSTKTNDIEAIILRIKYNNKNRKKGTPRSTIEQSTNYIISSFEDFTTASTAEQVGASVSSNASAKYYFCLFFYFYSVSKCLCDIYGQCS